MYYSVTMLAKIRGVLLERQGRAAASNGSHSDEELHIAAAALMVEAARLDGSFDDDERVRIAGILNRRFGLGDEAVDDIVELAVAKAERIPEIYGFTKTIRDNFSHDERVAMLEMLWEVAYTDGVLHDYEASLLRQVTGLLYVTDQESGAARKRALERLRD